MKSALYNVISELRVIVGFLGEKTQFAWWESNFLGQSSNAFLAPTFPRTTLLAQYHGVCEAALIVHDESVGIGHNFHLFRLPVSLERNIAKSIQEIGNGNALSTALKTKENALQRLAELADSNDAQSGPVHVGAFEELKLEQLIRSIAGIYLSAFEQNKKCFPFMRGTDEV